MGIKVTVFTQLCSAGSQLVFLPVLLKTNNSPRHLQVFIIEILKDQDNNGIDSYFTE